MKTNIIVQSLLLMFFSFNTLNAQTKMEVNSIQVDSILKTDSKLIVLDVRTRGEFTEGHVRGAINIDFHQPDALDRINKLDKNAKYIVYCRTKNRSGIVVNNMVQNGFKTIYQMMDGIVGWNMNKLPVEK
jgi:phage shock protein E